MLSEPGHRAEQRLRLEVSDAFLINVEQVQESSKFTKQAGAHSRGSGR